MKLVTTMILLLSFTAAAQTDTFSILCTSEKELTSEGNVYAIEKYKLRFEGDVARSTPEDLHLANVRTMIFTNSLERVTEGTRTGETVEEWESDVTYDVSDNIYWVIESYNGIKLKMDIRHTQIGHPKSTQLILNTQTMNARFNLRDFGGNNFKSAKLTCKNI